MSSTPSVARVSWVTLALAMALCLLALAVPGCFPEDRSYISVSTLLSSPDLARGREIRVEGVVVTATVVTDSRAVFYIVDQQGSSQRLEVDYRGAQPPAYLGGRPPVSGQESLVATVGAWPGRVVIITGTFDGSVFSAVDLVVRTSGPYREATSQPVSP